MPDSIKISIRVPDNLGLTKDQITALKKTVSVEIVASTAPLAGRTQQQIVTQMVEVRPTGG